MRGKVFIGAAVIQFRARAYTEAERRSIPLGILQTTVAVCDRLPLPLIAGAKYEERIATVV